MSTRRNAASHEDEDASYDVLPSPEGSEDTQDGPPADDVVPLGPVAAIIRRVILVGVLPTFSGVYLWQAITIAVPERTLAVSPRSFPIIIGSLLCLTAMALAVVELRRMLVARSALARGDEAAPEIDDDQERITSWRDAWVTVAALIVYVATFEALGFFVSTVVFLVGLSTYFAPRRLVRNTIVSIVFSFAVYLLFVDLLNVQLPDGLLVGVM